MAPPVSAGSTALPAIRRARFRGHFPGRPLNNGSSPRVLPITFRLRRPIALCMQLAAPLHEAFDLALCEVVRGDLTAPSAVACIAERAANLLENALHSDASLFIGLGRSDVIPSDARR